MSADSVHRYVVAYDVSSDLRRVRVAKTLESYGDRIQFSVFLIDIKPARMLRLTATVTGRIEPATDSLLVLDLGPLHGEAVRRMTVIGATRPITGGGPLVL